ncbi:hypothetical protein [Streptomyces subrutilus]|uniref:DUF8094 domain-containing protein n=1 Tax=Streptomyces subrutilus TaxID=36818 RepID=A0A1E5PL62_9ACTN|nr:hypothetical protein [Streptomyces subrutilus]OEJ30082.1 hypothetical protein BGK67_00670 [Streptomyces subrutilus]
MAGLVAGERQLRVGVVGVVAACALALVMTGCTPSETDPKAHGAMPPAPAAPTAPLVIDREQAEKVFNTYTWEQSQFRKPGGQDGIASVATDPLLSEYRARFGIPDYPGMGPVPRYRPEYLIPAERDQPGYPRWFVVISRDTYGQKAERAAGMTYFAQAEPGGQWKAAVMTWADDKPARQLQTGEFEDRAYEKFGFEVRDKEISAVTRDAAGAPVLSPTAGEDRQACRRYADYLSFTAPNGEPESDYFAPGELTSDVVEAYNHPENELGGVRRTFDLEVTGLEMPVLRLTDGKSLVTCSFIRTDRWQGKSGVSSYYTFWYGKDNPRDALLGGGNKRWLNTKVRLSMTVTFEVAPPGKTEVVGCNCLEPALLSAEGTAD